MSDPRTALHLLHGPYAVVEGRPQPVPEGSKRLVVLVAVRGPVLRTVAAGLLWPDVEPQRAAGNLRSAAWRLRCAELPLLDLGGDCLRLAPDVEVDVDQLARRVTAARGDASPLDEDGVLAAAVEALNLLPGWYDEWICAERERLRTAMLDAIDAIAIRLQRSGRCAEAIDAALVAVTADPLRASSQTALIAAHLGEGNLCEARRAYGAYRRVLREEIGVEPSPQLARLVGAGVPVGAAAGPGRHTRPATRRELLPAAGRDAVALA